MKSFKIENTNVSGELGASFIIQKNQNIVNLIKKFNLTLLDSMTADKTLGIFSG